MEDFNSTDVFKVQELEQRLEMCKWSTKVKGGGTNEIKIKEASVSAKCNIF